MSLRDGGLECRKRARPAVRGAWQEGGRQRQGSRLWGTLLVGLGMAMARAAAAEGGLKSRPLEAGLYGIALALLGMVWTARADGAKALVWRSGRGQEPRLPSPERALVAAAILLVGFAVLAVAVQIPAVHARDAEIVRRFWKCGGPAVTLVMRRISDAGGRDLIVYWLPAAIALLCVAGRFRALRFFLFCLLGTVGLEAFFKTLVHRIRPDLRHVVQFNSFPSGHALAVTVFVGALLVIWLPICRRPWHRVVLWSAAAGWVLLMSSARVYLNSHYVTDVVGGMLLGAAWTCLCQALLLAPAAVKA
jgi:membrane-associated phospholipid phosphatase